MRIGYVQDMYPKLSETFVYNEIAGLAKYHEMSVFSIEKANVDRPVPDNISVTYHNTSRGKDFTGAVLGTLRSGLLSRGPLESHYQRLAKEFSTRAVKLDVLHRHFPTNSIVHYMAEELGIPYTLTVHAWDIFSKNRYPHLDKLLETAKYIATISEFNKKLLMEENGVPENKIHVIHMGIDTKEYAFSARPGSHRVLSIGRFVEKKGFETGIEAVASLVPKLPDLEYHIVGFGPLESRLRESIAKHGVEENVKIITGLTDHELLQEYKEADAFLLPCTIGPDNDMDGIPVVLMEAMARGIPVVSTKLSGIPELVENGRTGSLIGDGDVQGFGNAIFEILKNPGQTKDIVKNARQRVESEFNIHNQVREMDSMLQRASGA